MPVVATLSRNAQPIRGAIVSFVAGVVSGPEGDELVVNAYAGLDGYDPSTGEWLWHADGHNEYPVAAATFDDDGMVYTARGHRAGPYLAIRLGGRGVVDDSHVAWRVATGAPYVSSILYYDGLIYMANGNGIVTAVEAKTGERVWQDRLGGIYSAISRRCRHDRRAGCHRANTNGLRPCCTDC